MCSVYRIMHKNCVHTVPLEIVQYLCIAFPFNKEKDKNFSTLLLKFLILMLIVISELQLNEKLDCVYLFCFFPK